MDTAGLRVPSKQISEFYTFNVSSVSILRPSLRCVTDANRTRLYLDVLNKYVVSPESTVSVNVIKSKFLL
jgi:hypothetical protein